MDVNAIFDAVSDMTAVLHAQDEYRKKQQEVFLAGRERCGSCWHWMKLSCKPEKEHKQFKSIESCPCGDYERTGWDTKWIQKLKAELIELEKAAKGASDDQPAKRR